MIQFKTIFNITRLALLMFAFCIVIIPGCSPDEDPVAPVVVQFSTTERVAGEQAGPQTITLTLDKAAKKNGTVKLSASEGASAYANFPSSVQITEGNTAVQFTVTPLNNAVLNAARVITFTISEPSNGFEIGENASLVFNITDDESPAQANFNANSSNTNEDNATGVDVTVNISAPAPGEGNLTINVASANATYATHYTTVPAAVNNVITLPVTVGQTSVTFKVIPVNNADVNAARVVNFTIATSTTNAVTVGTIMPTHAFTINDDEIASVATFAAVSNSVNENNADGIDVAIALDPQTTGAGTITVSFTSENAIYGSENDFTTIPAAINGLLTINVGSGVTNTSFKIIPVNNNTNNESLVINFAITGSTGIITLGSTNLTNQFTIVDDEIDPVKLTIADIRALYSGAPVALQTGGYIEATVTSSADNITDRNVFVQDATAGIVLRFTSINSTLALGDVIKVNVGSENTGVQLNAFQGLYQIEGLTYNLVEETGTGGIVTPEVITVAQANTGNYQGKLVTVEGVYIKEANGTKTYGGNNTISDGTNEIVTFVRTSTPLALFRNDVVPQGIGTITGVMTTFGTGATPQLLLRTANDVNLSLVGALTIGGTLTDFGSIAKGNTSTSKPFTVSGTGLVYNVIVTAPTNFQISTNDIDFSNSVELPFASVNGGPVTVYARFAPNSGTDGAKIGSIAITSVGAEKKIVDVSGTETGNTATYETLALWTFEVSPPAATDQAVLSNIIPETGIKVASSSASGVHASSLTDYSNPAGNGSLESFSANTWSTNDYYQFELNSTGSSAIKVSWDQVASSTGPSAFALYYSVNGVDFTKHADYTVVNATTGSIIYEDLTTSNSWSTTKRATNTSYSYDLSSITSLNNASTLVFRLVHTGTGITATGTNRVDNFKVEAIQN